MRLDEGAADVMVADDAELERQIAGRGIADGRRHAAVGHRDDEIGRRRRFARQFSADALARLIHGRSFDEAVRPGEVDVLEDAEPLRRPRKGADAGHAGAVEHHHLAGFDIAQEVGADDVEGTGFRGQDMALAEPAEHERADAERVANPDDALVGQRDEGVGAFGLAQGIDHPIDDVAAPAHRHQVDEHFGIGGRLEDRAAANELLAELAGVGEIAVVADRQTAELKIGKQRLNVAQPRPPGRRIPVMADRRVAGELLHHLRRAEVVAHLADTAVGVEVVAVMADDAASFLPAMLQGVETQRGQCRRLVVSVHPEDAALFMELVVVRPGMANKARRAGAGTGHCPPSLSMICSSRSRSSASAGASSPWSRAPGCGVPTTVGASRVRTSSARRKPSATMSSGNRPRS